MATPTNNHASSHHHHDDLDAIRSLLRMHQQQQQQAPPAAAAALPRPWALWQGIMATTTNPTAAVFGSNPVVAAAWNGNNSNTNTNTPLLPLPPHNSNHHMFQLEHQQHQQQQSVVFLERLSHLIHALQQQQQVSPPILEWIDNHTLWIARPAELIPLLSTFGLISASGKNMSDSDQLATFLMQLKAAGFVDVPSAGLGRYRHETFTKQVCLQQALEKQKLPLLLTSRISTDLKNATATTATNDIQSSKNNNNSNHSVTSSPRVTSSSSGSPPVDENDHEEDEATTLQQQQQSSTTKTFVRKDYRNQFPFRLHTVLSQARIGGYSDICEWKSEEYFKIVDKEKFEHLIIPKYFDGQSKYKSFQRQLNLYGFQRMTGGPFAGCYTHPQFRRSLPEQCQDIVRMDAMVRRNSNSNSNLNNNKRERDSTVDAATGSPTQRPKIVHHNKEETKEEKLLLQETSDDGNNNNNNTTNRIFQVAIDTCARTLITMDIASVTTLKPSMLVEILEKHASYAKQGVLARQESKHASRLVTALLSSHLAVLQDATMLANLTSETVLPEWDPAAAVEMLCLLHHTHVVVVPGNVGGGGGGTLEQRCIQAVAKQWTSRHRSEIVASPHRVALLESLPASVLCRILMQCD